MNLNEFHKANFDLVDTTMGRENVTPAMLLERLAYDTHMLSTAFWLTDKTSATDKAKKAMVVSALNIIEMAALLAHGLGVRDLETALADKFNKASDGLGSPLRVAVGGNGHVCMKGTNGGVTDAMLIALTVLAKRADNRIVITGREAQAVGQTVVHMGVDELTDDLVITTSEKS